MSRPQTIVGIGEVMIVESPDGESVGGIAAEVSRAARRIGQRGVCISRLGQDEDAQAAIQVLTGEGVEVAQLQSDPDLSTGRRLIRVVMGERQERIDPRSAFDNLQWDFDLEDVAARADGIVYGLLARRDAQARTTIDRFLTASAGAVRIADLTNGDPQGPIDRTIAQRSLEVAHGVVVDRPGLLALLPGSGGATAELATTLLKERSLRFALLLEDRTLYGCTVEGLCQARANLPTSAVTLATVTCLHMLLRGRALDDALEAADRAVQAAAETNAPIPPDVLDGARRPS